MAGKYGAEEGLVQLLQINFISGSDGNGSHFPSPLLHYKPLFMATGGILH